ncbi:MAG: cofactor-independent phosphoglycerate mutase [candidate division FCPU426 bacterium]
MKYLVLLCDGMSDHPQPGLGNKTPMQVAVKPNMDRLCSQGETGLLNTGVAELPMGSDVGNLTVLGYDPRKYFTGRAPLEAKNLGVELSKGETAFRCNLVHVKDGVMDDYSAGHLDTESGRELIKMLNKRLGAPGVRFAGGTQYRHLLMIKGAGFENARCTPPHDISGKPIADYLPQGAKNKELRKLMEDSTFLLEGHEVNRERRAAGKKTANMIWLWGQGRGMELPSFDSRYGVKGSVISAVDLIKGLGRYAGLEVVEVPGATGWIDTDFKGKAEAGIKALKKRDFLFLHFEVTDEAGHKGDAAVKVKGIEEIDSKVLGPMLEALKGQDLRIMVLPDHSTPLELKTHIFEPVPYFIWDSRATSGSGLPFDEASALSTGRHLVEGWDLMGRFIKG